MSKLIIKKVESEKELKISQKIREIVFCDEQKVSKQIEFDGLDDVSEPDAMIAVVLNLSALKSFEAIT